MDSCLRPIKRSGYCAAVWCNNFAGCRVDEPVSLFTFPKDERCVAWVKFSMREDLGYKTPQQLCRMLLCSDHFHPSQFRKLHPRILLRRDANPTIIEKGISSQTSREQLSHFRSAVLLRVCATGENNSDNAGSHDIDNNCGDSKASIVPENNVDTDNTINSSKLPSGESRILLPKTGNEAKERWDFGSARDRYHEDANSDTSKPTCLLETLDDTDMFFLSMLRMTKKLPKVEQSQIKLGLSNLVLSAETRCRQQLPPSTPDPYSSHECPTLQELEILSSPSPSTIEPMTSPSDFSSDGSENSSSPAENHG